MAAHFSESKTSKSTGESNAPGVQNVETFWQISSFLRLQYALRGEPLGTRGIRHHCCGLAPRSTSQSPHPNGMLAQATSKTPHSRRSNTWAACMGVRRATPSRRNASGMCEGSACSAVRPSTTAWESADSRAADSRLSRKWAAGLAV